MTEIKLPQYLEKFRESVGLAVCALVVVDKKRRKLNEIMPERERYTKVVDLICKFKVDSYQIMPEHCHFTSQQKLLSEYASQFLWLSYIPLHGFNINWHYCTQFEVALETSCDELFGVKNCGLHLIHKHERMMIDRMIMESTVPSSTSHKGKEPQIQWWHWTKDELYVLHLSKCGFVRCYYFWKNVILLNVFMFDIILKFSSSISLSFWVVVVIWEFSIYNFLLIYKFSFILFYSLGLTLPTSKRIFKHKLVI